MHAAMLHNSISVRELESDDLLNHDLYALLDHLRGTNGMTSLAGEWSVQLQYLDRMIDEARRGSACYCVATHYDMVKQVRTIVGIAGLRYHNFNYYYSPTHEMISRLNRVVEFCSAFVHPDYRQHRVYERLCEFRVMMAPMIAKKRFANFYVIESRAKYIDGLPEYHLANKECWANETPVPNYTSDSLVSPLREFLPSHSENAHTVIKWAKRLGFIEFGINTYDNGQHLLLPVDALR